PTPGYPPTEHVLCDSLVIRRRANRCPSAASTSRTVALTSRSPQASRCAPTLASTLRDRPISRNYLVWLVHDLPTHRDQHRLRGAGEPGEVLVRGAGLLRPRRHRRPGRDRPGTESGRRTARRRTPPACR